MLDKFESEVMQRIIREDLLISDLLEKQYRVAKVINRHFTGVGFFTYYEIFDKNLKLTERLNFEMGIVQARIDGLAHGMGFILFVREGFIDMLEGYTYGEPWSNTVVAYSLE